MKLNKGKLNYEFTGDYRDLQEWLLNSSVEEILPDYLKSYQAKLDTAHDLIKGWGHMAKGKKYMIRQLMLKYNCNERYAHQLLYEAGNWYYAEPVLTKDEHTNFLVERLDKFIMEASLAKQYNAVAKLQELQINLMGLMKEEPAELPEEYYRKPIMIYTAKPKDLGLPEVDRRELLAQINSFEVSEKDRNRLKFEAKIVNVENSEYENESTEVES